MFSIRICLELVVYFLVLVFLNNISLTIVSKKKKKKKNNTEIIFINTNHNCLLNSNKKNCENFMSLNAKNQNTTCVKEVRGFNLTKKLIPLRTIFLKLLCAFLLNNTNFKAVW